MDEEEFQAWKKQKDFEIKRRMEAVDYVAECLTEKGEYVLWQNHYN
jgi:hypothetical protein